MAVIPQIFRLLWGSLLILPLIYLYWPRDGAHLLHTRPWRRASGSIANGTAGFSKILVINRPARTDRRDAMTLAAAVSNLTLDWVDGVDGDTVEERVLPPGDRPKSKSSDTAVRGSWRAHMNALRRVVEEGLPSALIMEDDADWDLRIKSQLQTFGAASSLWLWTTRDMVSQSSDSWSTTDDHPIVYQSRIRRVVASREANTNLTDRQAVERDSILLDQQSTASTSSSDHPYGEDWDVIWLGHCGTAFPEEGNTSLPLLRVVIGDDPTVPAPRHLKPHPFAFHDAIGQLYPPHTRVVHAAASPTTACTLAYAVSQRGARKLLWQFGLEDFASQWDLMLGNWCSGGYVDRSDKVESEDGKQDGDDEAGGTGTEVRDATRDEEKARRGRWEKSKRRQRQRQQPTCLTVQPPIFGHYFAKKGASDIRGQGGGYVSKVGTPYVRWSVRMNLDVLAEGGTASDVVDQLPDEGEAMW
ncbi:glycosyltransferase family 25 protein [Apiospora arundinis]|uniref:Glycosyltransferase family 25 protein n=1 Tax=Apiospora arundinis TaxID=335852 RepID=A0ABR2HTK7_9PEZI